MQRELRVQVGGREVALSQFGAQDGYPVFFLHGWPGSRKQGRLLEEAAREQGLRLICPDRPGIGESERITGRTLGDWPAFHGLLADALGIGRFSVFAVSGGAPYALSAAYHLGRRVDAVGICCGAVEFARLPDRSAWHPAYRLLEATRARLPFLLPWLLEAARGYIALVPEAWQVPLLWYAMPARDRAAMRHRGNHRIMAASNRLAFRGSAAGLQEDAEVYLELWNFDVAAIEVPVLFWHGDKDANIPLAMARPTMDRVPGARVRVFAGEGHYSLPLLHGAALLAELAAHAGDRGCR